MAQLGHHFKRAANESEPLSDRIGQPVPEASERPAGKRFAAPREDAPAVAPQASREDAPAVAPQAMRDPASTGALLACAVQAGADIPAVAADYADADEFKPQTAKRMLNGCVNVLTTLIFIAALLFTVVVVATTIASGKNEASLFGWKPYVVLSDSMQQDFQVGDMVVTREIEDTAALQPGDIISFESIDPNSYGEIFTHRIREATEYEGEAAFITYGSTTGDNDTYPALASRVKGRLAFVIPKAGYVFDFFKSPAGYVVLVLIPFSILIGLQIRNIIRLVREDREAQQRALVEEQKRVNEMEAEIERLSRLLER